MDRPSILDAIIAPLRWVERARGWKRFGLISAYLIAGLIVGVVAWRESSLWRLPRAREPFDDPNFGRATVADVDNAVPLYREAERVFRRTSRANYRASAKHWAVATWSLATPEVRRWAEDSRPTLVPWLAATDKPDAFVIPPREMTSQTILDGMGNLADLARLAELEATRLETAGDLAGAWRYHRGVLRSSRHASRHGGSIQRMWGYRIFSENRGAVKAWAQAPGMTSDLLRRAIRDVEEAKAMTPPNSEMVTVDYFVAKNLLDLPEMGSKSKAEEAGEFDWTGHITPVARARRFFRNEPERSHRVHRLITLGILAQCDRPPADRARPIDPRYSIYQVDAKTPPVVASLAPEELMRFADGSAYSRVGWAIESTLGWLDAESALFDEILIAMAERAYELDHGKGAATYGELVGPYLKALPDGFSADEATSSAPAPSN